MTSPYPSLDAFAYLPCIGKMAMRSTLSKALMLVSFADEAYSILLMGQDVYACGALEARYWKNGTSVYFLQ
jgi:hypothetical protein